MIVTILFTSINLTKILINLIKEIKIRKYKINKCSRYSKCIFWKCFDENIHRIKNFRSKKWCIKESNFELIENKRICQKKFTCFFDYVFLNWSLFWRNHNQNTIKKNFDFKYWIYLAGKCVKFKFFEFWRYLIKTDYRHKQCWIICNFKCLYFSIIEENSKITFCNWAIWDKNKIFVKTKFSLKIKS